METNMLETLSREQLIALCNDYAKDWLAMDGLWFQSAERRRGMDEAMEMDVEVWRSYTVIEAKRIKALLALPEQAGLEGLAQALRMRMYARLNRDEVIIEGNTLTYRVSTCRVQAARSRKGMPWHPCRPVGLVEYDGFAKTIDSRFTTECVSCYPEVTDQSCACCWRFTLQE